MRSVKGFTLVELLIVVVILALLAAVALPKFSNASATARASMLADDLRVIRTQITVSKGQHNGLPPGYEGPDVPPSEAAFVKHMTMSSDAAWKTAAVGTAGYRFGPYLREIPPNPVNGKTSVQVIGDDEAFPDEADDSHGWTYQPSTTTFKADCPGADATGKAYVDY